MTDFNFDNNVLIVIERTFWWHHLEENTCSMRHNHTNETTKQLNLNSKLDPNQSDMTEWWQNLNLSNSENNVSIGSIQNISAGMI